MDVQWYGDQMKSFDDYLHFSRKLNTVVGPLATQLLRSGNRVVMDFQANTKAGRRFFRSVFTQAGAAHALHFVQTYDQKYLERIAKRNIAIGISMVLMGACASKADTFALVRLSVQQSRVENGKTLDMEFRETERCENYSIVEVIFVSGGSVPSSLFELRGVCTVARAQRAKYFTIEPITGASTGTRYRILFSPHPPALPLTPRYSPSVNQWLSVAECGTLGFWR